MKELVANKIYLNNLMIAVFSWVASQLAYYTIYFHIRHLGGDFFINIVVFSVCELSAYAIGQYITSKIGIKKSLAASYALAVLSAIMYLKIR